MFAYDVKIGTYTKKGHFQIIYSQVVSSKNSDKEIRDFFEKKYEGLSVVINKCKIIDIDEECKKEITQEFLQKSLVNKQRFHLKDFLSESQLSAWKDSIRRKLSLEEDAENIIREKLTKRIEVKDVRNINIDNHGNFVCEIIINGELWQLK